MNLKLLRGYFLAVLALLILAAAAILLINNIGGQWSMQFFWKPISLAPAAAMLVISACGVVVWYTILKLIPAAMRRMREGKRASRIRDAQQRLKSLENEKTELQ